MAINKKYLEALKESTFFKNIDEKKIKKVLISENIFKAKKGEEIISKNMFLSEMQDKFISIILKGQVMITTDRLPNGTILKNDGKSGIFGEHIIFNDNKNSGVIVSALSNIVYLKLTEDKIKEMFEEDKTYMFNMMKIMSNNIEKLIGDIKCFTAVSAEQKIALYLREHLKEYENNGKKEYKVILDMSMSKFALTLSLGRASLYRAMDTLENNYVILKSKKEIKILDLKKLNKICES